MTVAENTQIVPRVDGVKRFWFTLVRGTSRTAFFPPSSPILRFANMAAGTLELPGLPQGLVQTGDRIEVRYGTSSAASASTVVFSGLLDGRVETWGRGDECGETATFADAWSVLERIVYRQTWAVSDAEGTTDIHTSTANVVLNQDSTGLPISMTGQIADILDYAHSVAPSVTYQDGDIDAGSQVLPADPTTDITCAAAIVRTLRFFPKVMACCTDASTIKVWTPSSADASWIAGAKKLSRSKSHTAHPVVGVDIATDATDVAASGAGGVYRLDSHQRAGNTDSIDTLHIFMPLSGGSASSSWETLDCRGHLESLSLYDGWHSIGFWIAHHPRLKGLGGHVTFASEPTLDEGTEYDYITDLSVETLRRFGLQASIMHLSCRVTIDVDAETQENVYLTMDFVTTNARERSYTQSTGSSAEGGDALPDGLAQAILDQRSGTLQGEDITIRLGDALPAIGDAVDGLYLQNFSVDCYDLTAQCHFGHPNYLSAESMRDLLTGFRGRSFSSAAPVRDSADPSEGQVEMPEEQPSIKPTATTEFSPGSYKKLKLSQASGQGGGGSISLDSTKVAQGGDMTVHKLVVKRDGGIEAEQQILSTRDVTINMDGPEQQPSSGYCNSISGEHPGDGGGGPGGGTPSNDISSDPCKF